MSRLLQKYKTDVYLSKSDWQNFCRRSEREIKDEVAEVVPWYGRCFFRFSPHKINLYDENALVLLLMKFPLIKKMLSETSVRCLPSTAVNGLPATADIRPN